MYLVNIKSENTDNTSKKLLTVALSLVFLVHGVVVYFTMPKTYDAFVHIFFADHYSRFWFEPWEYRWYTGFFTTSYPPLVHQCIALISKIFPLKIAFCIYAITVFNILILGIYRFSKLFFSKNIAGVAAIVAVLLSSLIETLHIYGQMPTLTGISFLLNAIPFLYHYIINKRSINLIMALSFLGVVVSSHHVTAIFGMFFFIGPTILMAIIDSLPEEKKATNIFLLARNVFFAALSKIKQFILFFSFVIFLAVTLIFPYWYWSKTDPINQVSIPHGSRDNFLSNTSSGLVFFVIPLILVFALLPAISFLITKQKRFWGWAISFFLCLLLGSGGTTPLPKMILGSNAFNILTLDRFGFWASIIAIPFIANFIYSFLTGFVKEYLYKKITPFGHFILSRLSTLSYLLFILFVFHLGSFRPLQPKEVEIQPIVNFLNRDEHLRWRFLTLGFGDQMAWLSSNSLAASVDGNYHSARRLPELTTRPIERLENAKFSGEDGLASLNDFLTKAEKYNLKYVFSNDRYYDPLLYFTGWSRTIRLENGIMVWEKGNISTIKPITPKPMKKILKLIWGILPVSSLVLACLLTIFYLVKIKKDNEILVDVDKEHQFPGKVVLVSSFLPICFFSIFMLLRIYELLLVKEQKNPETSVKNYYNHLDFQDFEKAFAFFDPSPTYPLDQYLLEKSVKDGGLLPSYAKLHDIKVKTLEETEKTSYLEVYTKWRTSLGFRETTDSLQLIKKASKWYIIPKPFTAEIPQEQIRDFTYTIFKKQGKRNISSFPTIKDDRIKKPFAAFKQVNLVKVDSNYNITGEILNSDDIAINLGLSVKITFKDSTINVFYPTTKMYYNLSPKESTLFQIELDSLANKDLINVKQIEIYAETDVSERGYYHGGMLGYSVDKKGDSIHLNCKMYNELTTEINIPGVLYAEKDDTGNILQVGTLAHTKTIRSGLSESFNFNLSSASGKAKKIVMPIALFINGQERNALPINIDKRAKINSNFTLLPHCFISQEIYLQ